MTILMAAKSDPEPDPIKARRVEQILEVVRAKRILRRLQKLRGQTHQVEGDTTCQDSSE